MGAKATLQAYEDLNVENHSRPALKMAWVTAKAVVKFTPREQALFEFLLGRVSAKIPELFEIATRFGRFGEPNLQAHVRAGSISKEDMRLIQEHHAQSRAVPRSQQQYLGGIITRLNAKLRAAGMSVQIKPGAVKQTYELMYDD